MLRLIEKTGMHDKVMIISVYSDSVAKAKELDPQMTTAHVEQQQQVACIAHRSVIK